MRAILARLPGAVISPRLFLLPLLALLLVITVIAHPPRPFLATALQSAGDRTQMLADRLRLRIEPVIATGGMIVSRNRNTIAGAVTGCAAGATLGAATTAAFGLATGGVGLAAIPVGAGIGCLVAAIGGGAMGYPLDSWALSE